MYTIVILISSLLVVTGLAVWKLPTTARVLASLLIVWLTVYTTHWISTKREYNRIQSTYFRGLGLAFSSFEELARNNDSDELAKRVTDFYPAFVNATHDEALFNKLVEQMMSPTQLWKDK